MNSTYDLYWAQHNAYMPPHQTAVFELPASKVPSLIGSPASGTYDQFPSQIPQEYYTQIAEEPMPYNAYQMPLTPSEFGSDHDTGYCSPPPISQHMDPMYAQGATPPASTERQHTTSGRRRAQNRAAQRAFRERKDKHARDLEIQLGALQERFNKLDSKHSELNTAYERLRKTIELLTQTDNDSDGEIEHGKVARRRSSNTDTLTRKLLEILHGELKSAEVKQESSPS